MIIDKPSFNILNYLNPFEMIFFYFEILIEVELKWNFSFDVECILYFKIYLFLIHSKNKNFLKFTNL